MSSEHSPLLYAIIDTLVGANIDSDIAAIEGSIFNSFVSSNQSADRGTYISAFVSAYMDTDISANDSSIEIPFVYAHADSNVAAIISAYFYPNQPTYQKSFVLSYFSTFNVAHTCTIFATFKYTI